MLNEKQIQLLKDYYKDSGVDDVDINGILDFNLLEEIEDEENYFHKNYMTLIECKNFGISSYDAERIIELREVLGYNISVSDAIKVIGTFEKKYDIDIFDLDDVLTRK